MSMFYYMKENDIRNKDEIKLRQINIETFHFVFFSSIQRKYPRRK